MRESLSILVLTWVFLIAPGICLGAFGAHGCGCDEATCEDCTSASHGSSHDCHETDPCPKDVCRTESEDETELTTAAPAYPAGPACDAGSAVPTDLRDYPDGKPAHHSPAPICCADLRVLEGMPLLI